MPRKNPNAERDLVLAIRAAGHRGVMRSALVLKDKVIRMHSQAGHGRIYRRKGFGVHRASSPGEPPAPWTGVLKGKIAHRDMSTARLKRVRVGTSHVAARRLEYGGRHLAPRPAWRPGYNLARARMAREMEKSMKDLRL